MPMKQMLLVCGVRAAVTFLLFVETSSFVFFIFIFPELFRRRSSEVLVSFSVSSRRSR